jgi:predicted nucleic acid-binding protein
MTAVFADTSFYLALLSTDDEFHDRAVQLSIEMRPPIVVTEFVLLETGNSLSSVNQRRLFVELLPHLQADPTVRIIPASSQLLQSGYELYRRREDKDWSMTDCTSFVVMEELGVREALTTDHHFEQAGFTALLRSRSVA